MDTGGELAEMEGSKVLLDACRNRIDKRELIESVRACHHASAIKPAVDLP